MTGLNITISVSLLSFILTTLIPFTADLIANRLAPGPVKAAIALALSVLAALVQAAIAQGGTFNPLTLILTVVLQFLVASGLHSGLLKHLRITGRDGWINRMVPGGIGAPGVDGAI